MIPRRWWPPIAWAALVLVLTSVPLPPTAVSGIEGVDKVVHAGLYGVLGALAARSAWDARPGLAAVAGVLLGVLLFAALDEWHQSFIPGRSADPRDWLADAVGAIAGAALAVRTLPRPERST